MDDNSLVSIQNLRVRFQGAANPALFGLDLEIPKGKVTAVVGESGSGKSLTALTLLRLLPESAIIDHGKVLWQPEDKVIDLLEVTESDLSAYRGKEIAMIFQEPMTSLNPVFTCGYQVAEAILAHHPVDKEAAKIRTLELFSLVKMTEPERMYNAYPHQLSGGQKQRVMIAMALANNPRLLIADEPTTALDVTVQRAILSLLRELHADLGMTMLFISHDLGVVADLADFVAVMFQGHLVEYGPASEVLKNPKHAYTRSLLACRPAANLHRERLPVTEDFLSVSTLPDGHLSWVEKQPEPVGASKDGTNLLANPVLEVEKLTVEYLGTRNFWGRRGSSVQAVNDVSFTVLSGELLGIVGESGCGKSTLSNALLGLLPITKGNVRFNGNRLDELSPAGWRALRKEIQIVFQDPYASLNPRMRVGEAIMEPMLVHGLGKNQTERRQRALNLLDRVQMPSSALDRYPHEFSGGQRQRIVIARALSVEPSFIIFDESVSALDVSVQAVVLNLIADLRDSLGFSGIFISHDLSVINHISQRVIVMQHGRIVEQGDTRSLFESPREDYTKQLIASIPGSL
jgi:peptide/nickel transport system ATP-binding protein